MADRVNIVIADDYVIVRKGLKTALEVDPTIVAMDEAESGEATVKPVAALRPKRIVPKRPSWPGNGGWLIEEWRSFKKVSRKRSTQNERESEEKVEASTRDRTNPHCLLRTLFTPSADCDKGRAILHRHCDYPTGRAGALLHTTQNTIGNQF
jgi:hypothetical protein